ncbi:MAG: protein kinase [Actinobacteria bacterium]|nr:protein kinase [Actinomycetota bacterium]
MTSPSQPSVPLPPVAEAAPTPTPRMPARPALDPGDLLASRYRLTQVISDEDGPALLWRATDEVLARPVAVKVLPANGRAGQAAAAPFLEAAGQASGLAHPGLARVYDAAREERPALRSSRLVDVAYVISEWIDGRSASEVLRTDGPLEPAQAVRMVQQAAEALAAAHARGLGHGRIHPGNLLIAADGRVRLTDAAVAAAAHRGPLPPPGPDGLPTPGRAAPSRGGCGARCPSCWPSPSSPPSASPAISWVRTSASCHAGPAPWTRSSRPRRAPRPACRPAPASTCARRR